MVNTNWLDLAGSIEPSVFNMIDGNLEDCIVDSLSKKANADRSIRKYLSRDGRFFYSISVGSFKALNRAVASASSAFDDCRWSSLSVTKRSAALIKLADLIEKHKETFALYESLDVGKPISQALAGDVYAAQNALRSCAEKAGRVLSATGFDGGELIYQHRKPVGVVGAITGWNFPLMLAAQKIGPALAMGNTLVLKPSEFTCLSTCFLAELALEAGIPPGVLNVVNGAGSIVGDALACHPDVNLLGFVGSSVTGKKLMQSAGQSNMKRLILECGGKSPYIVFDDCPEDLDAVAADIVAKAFANQGAFCVAGTRLLIQESIKDRLLAKVIAHTKKVQPQDPLDPEASFGAIINEAHLHKIQAYIESGKEEGAQCILGGQSKTVVPGGYYFEPTIFDQVNPEQRIAQEEIFGPVLSVFSFKNEAEAIQLANNTAYGLAAYAATQNISRARRLGQSLNAGRVKILATSQPAYGALDIGADKHRESGMGYSFGLEGMAAFTATSTVHLLT